MRIIGSAAAGDGFADFLRHELGIICAVPGRQAHSPRRD
jgi:hypothetical protein